MSSDYSEIKIKLKFDLDTPAPNFERDWNKPPTALMLVAIRSVDGKRTPKMMRWGLLPHWAKDEKIAYSTFNARAEEFTAKPAFREPTRSASNNNAQDANGASLSCPSMAALEASVSWGTLAAEVFDGSTPGGSTIGSGRTVGTASIAWCN